MKFKKSLVIIFMLIFILHTSMCYALTEQPEISADAAILIDSSSEKVLYSKNENQWSVIFRFGGDAPPSSPGHRPRPGPG